jgi:hypothetical protein
MNPSSSRPQPVPGFEQLYDYRARLLDRFEQQPAEFAAVLAGIPEPEWRTRQDERGRTLHMIAAHVRFLETLAFMPRIRAVLNEENPNLVAYPTHHFADERYDPDEPMAAILEEWSHTRAEIVQWLRPLDAAGWTRLGFHAPSGERTLQWWVERTYAHAREHLDEIRGARLPAL